MSQEKKTIYLMRHGQDDDRFLGGWSSVSLTEVGREQVALSAQSLASKSVIAIYASDLVRAKEAATIVSARLDQPITYLPDFRETNNGALAGLTAEEFQNTYSGLYWRTLEWEECYPNGESPAQFFGRIQSAWEVFKQTAPNASLLITHAGVIDAILCLENGVSYTNKKVTYPAKHAQIITLVSERN